MIIAEFTSTSKMNLFLDIKSRDPSDGYHFIESIFTEIPWGDDFTLFEAPQDRIVFSGLGAEEIPEDNTVGKALHLFKQKFGISDSFRIDIWKNVPSGAGFGGGSGDAGALLRFLCGRYRKSFEDVKDIAARVGSDVSFFLTGGSAHVSGKGELVAPISGRLEQGLVTLIAVPKERVSTKQAYESLGGNFNYSKQKNLRLFIKKDAWGLDFLAESSYNIFDENLVSEAGILNSVYLSIKRAADPLLILMSGSGSGFVLFYNDPQSAAEAEVRLINLNCGIHTQQIWW